PEPKPEPAKAAEPPATSAPASPAPPAVKVDPLAASLRAALAPEPEEEHAHDEPEHPAEPQGEERPPRPEGLFFRSSPEEVTVSAPGTQPEMQRATRPADEHDREALEQTFAPGIGVDDLLRTSEGQALDFLDSTLARPPKLSEPPPALRDTGENPVSGVQHEGDAANGGEDFEEEVIIADDLAEMIDSDDEHAPPTEETSDEPPKRSSPPPVPRQ
ncbi:MAG: hypothetical protein ACRELB_15535, partial [Polyangiaceae bacterium]